MAEMTCPEGTCTCTCHGDPDDIWLYPGEAARLLGVGTRTLARWTNTGKLQSGRTPGGARRYQSSVIYRLRDRMIDAPVHTHVPNIF